MPAHHQRRWQPLLGQWVLVASASQSRPWSGAVVGGDTESPPQHDPTCYLCPGVTRANGSVNPDYQGPWAFDNDFASLSTEIDTSDLQEEVKEEVSVLRRTAPPSGRCRVLCWSEQHHLTLAELSPDNMLAVAQLWQSEYATLKADPLIKQVLIFENKGSEVGVSNRHPHGQVYATGFLTDNTERMLRTQSDYAIEHDGRLLLQDLIAREEYRQELLVDDSTHFKTIVPFAARFPFETWIVPRRHVSGIDELTDVEINDLAQIYQRQAQRYDRLFGRSTPNVTLLHNAPTDSAKHNQYWCFHIVMQPPLRDATTLKYLAGFESGSANIVNPVQPEQAAARLRDC